MQFQRLIDQTQPLPVDFIGSVVSRPVETLPIVNARLVRGTTEIHLGKRGLEVLHGFDMFPNLECLWLNDNKLSAIEGLDTNFRIKRLYAPRNRISTLRGSLLCFKHLEELDFSHNAISNLDRALSSFLRGFLLLKKLWLHNNPVAQEVDYRLRVLAAIPSLNMLDNVVITPDERAEANAKYFGAGGGGVGNGVSLTSSSSSSSSSTLAASTSSSSIIGKSATARTASTMMGNTGSSGSHSNKDTMAAAILHARRALLEASVTGPVFTYDVPVYSNTSGSSTAASFAQGATASGTGAGIGASGIPVGFGRGGSPFLVPRPDIVFGVEPGKTSVQKDFAREIKHIKEKRLAEQLAHTQREFAESARRADWNVTLGAGNSSEVPPVTSALINITQPANTEDVVTKKVREGMLARGVEPDLLTEASPYRRIMTTASTTPTSSSSAAAAAEAAAGAVKNQNSTQKSKLLQVDAKSQMLGMLAPVVPLSCATHPIDSAFFSSFESMGNNNNSGGASLSAATATIGGGSNSLSAALNRTGGMGGGVGGGADLFRTQVSSLPPSLANTLAATGVKTVTEAQLAKAVLEKTGLRLKPNRSKAETMERYGLTMNGKISITGNNQSLLGSTTSAGGARTGGANALASLMGTTIPRTTSAGTSSSPTDVNGVPVLPTITSTGRLGEWDKYKLRIIFTQSDADGSGELSRDEIKECLSACADYGFCASTGEGTGGGFGGLGGAASALLGTQELANSASANAAAAAYNAKLNTMMDAVFDAIDVDKSGTVTWKEFLDVVETGVVPPKQVDPSAETAAAEAKAAAEAAESKSGSRTPKSKAASLLKLGGTSGSKSPTSSASGKRATSADASNPATLLAAASAVLNQHSKKSKKLEPLRVPQLKFRSLTAMEASARAERYFRQATEAWRRSQAVPADVYDRDVQLERARKDMLASSERGNRLAFIAQALGGELDPPEKKPTPPRPRSDIVEFTSLVPITEEAKRRARGGRTYRVPYPGDEVDLDETTTVRLLHPDSLVLAAEEENEELRRIRSQRSDRITRTLGNPSWERYRLQAKAKAPHVLHGVVEHI